MGMPTIQEIYGNLEKHKLELKRYKRNGDKKKKRSLALKTSSSFDDELDEIETKDEKMKWPY